MAKGSDLKKIELKVSVNCCDGCKKKVKKALQSIEGVLKIEVDCMQPKVTVLGNVEPQILVKRLSKVGKQAEVWRHGNQINGAAILDQKKGKEKGEGETMAEVAAKAEGKQSKNYQQQAKPASDSNTRKDQDEKGSKKEDEMIKIDSKKEDEMMKMGNPFPFPAQYALTMYPLPMPCYAVPSYSYAYAAAAAPLPQAGCGLEYYQQQAPVFQTPTTRVGDYFSDENTVGCSVM